MASSWGTSWLSSWADSWGPVGGAVVTPADTHDGGSIREEDYRRYRRYLKKLERAAAKFEEGKYTAKTVDAVLEMAEQAAVATPAIAHAANENEIDYAAILAEMAQVQAYFRDLIEYKKLQMEIEREKEDEQIILMLMEAL